MNEEVIESVELNIEPGFPLCVSPRIPDVRFSDVRAQLTALVRSQLLKIGAILFRGFSNAGAEEFQTFCASFGHSLLNYEFGSTPRSKINGRVYTSTEYPAHQHIPLHNEQAYTREWPMKIWFYCAQAAPEGGETPIADSRTIYRTIDPKIRQRFTDLGLIYVRNYGHGLDLPWQQVFNTDNSDEVESYCNKNHIEFIWLDDGGLRTWQRCQGIAHHPFTGEAVWFNQAHLFHLSAFDADTREALLESVGEAYVPRHVYYGDGSPISDLELDHIRAVLAQHTVIFPWQEGDVLMLDNMLSAHARLPFKGPRKVMVAMAQGHGADFI